MGTCGKRVFRKRADKKLGPIRHSFVCALQREVVVGKDVGSTDLPGLHPESGGQGWGASLLECVAIIEVGGHQDGCATGCVIHPSKGVENREYSLC